MGFLSRLLGGGPRDLLADLAEDYRAEAMQAAQLRIDADRARYPQVADELRRLAELESELQVAVDGEEIPYRMVRPALANEPDRDKRRELDARAKRRRLIEQIAHWDPDEPEIVALLSRIEQEDAREGRAYDAVIMRSDPQAID